MIRDKKITQKAFDFALAVKSTRLKNHLKFAAVEPQTVIPGAAVDQLEFASGLADMHFIHFRKTNRTLAFFFIRLSLAEGTQDMFCCIGTVQQEFQFAAVEPDAPAGGAIIDFDLIKLKDEHGLAACGAIHESSPIVFA